MALAGNNIVVDHVLSEPWRLLDCLTVFAAFDVVFVGIFCPPGELRRRELAPWRPRTGTGRGTVGHRARIPRL